MPGAEGSDSSWRRVERERSSSQRARRAEGWPKRKHEEATGREESCAESSDEEAPHISASCCGEESEESARSGSGERRARNSCVSGL